jgi:hypothetical protein
MCLSLRNASAVLDHQDGRAPGVGYTRTRHHIGHLSPGDWWFCGPEDRPRVVTGVHRRNGQVVLVDQFGATYPYPCDAIVETAVPDARVLTRPTARTA